METQQTPEGGEVEKLNPDKREATHEMTTLQKIIMNRPNTTSVPGAKTLQKVGGEFMVPNPNKNRIDPDEIGPI